MDIGIFGLLLIVAAILTGLQSLGVATRIHLGWLGVMVFFIALIVR